MNVSSAVYFEDTTKLAKNLKKKAHMIITM